MKKSLIFWFAAATCAAWILVGCEQEAKTEYVTQKEMIHLDVAAKDITELAGYLVDDGKALSIGFTGSSTDGELSAALTVPDKKVVYILPSAELDVKTYALTVDGIVYVGGTLTAKSTGVVKIPGSGHVGVVKGGALSVETAASVNDGATPTPVTVLGSSKVGFASEITLTLAAAGTTAAQIKTALGYFSNGTLDASASTAVVGLKPSAAVAEFGTLVSAAKTLIIEANDTETEVTALTIPAGLELTTSDTLATLTGTLTVDGKLTLSGAVANVTTLVVNGTLSANDSATFASVTTLTVNGTLTAGTGALFDGIADKSKVTGTGSLTAGAVASDNAILIIESGLKSATLATTTITDADLEIPANTVRVFTGDAAPSGNVTVNGTAVFSGAAAPVGNVTVAAAGVVTVRSSGSLTIDAGKALDIAAEGVVALTDTGSVVLATAATAAGNHAKLTGTGTLTAQDTEISGGTGGWEAVPSNDNAQTVTIASTVTGGQASITGSTNSGATVSLKGGAGATITQKAGTINNNLTLTTVTVNLAGTGTTKAGEITLVSGANPGKLTFTAATSKVLAGAGVGGSAISGLTGLAIGGKAIVNSGLAKEDFENATGKLVLLGGTTAGNFTASTTAGADVEINSTVAASGSA